MMTVLCYLHFFPPPYHDQGWGPYAYFHMVEELQATNSNNARNQQPTCEHHIGLSGQWHNRTPRNDLESGSM
uniref:Uncharacterized protein n=1 Tax=Arundo donax TaxID=35708 RepID=A0A0A8YZ87_ARUDO